jgi:hypothetical protein
MVGVGPGDEAVAGMPYDGGEGEEGLCGGGLGDAECVCRSISKDARGWPNGPRHFQDRLTL